MYTSADVESGVELGLAFRVRIRVRITQQLESVQRRAASCSLQLKTHNFLSNIHTSSMACMCPIKSMFVVISRVIGVYSVFLVRAIDTIALFTPIHFAISATPTSQGTLFTYLRYTWRQLWMCAKYLNSVYVAEFHGNSLHVWDDHSLKVRYSLSMTAAVSSPCAVLSSPSILKDLSCATGVRLRVRLSITVTVTIRVKISVSVYSYGSAWSYGFHILTGRRTTSHILVKNRNSITQHTSIN